MRDLEGATGHLLRTYYALQRASNHEVPFIWAAKDFYFNLTPHFLVRFIGESRLDHRSGRKVIDFSELASTMSAEDADSLLSFVDDHRLWRAHRSYPSGLRFVEDFLKKRFGNDHFTYEGVRTLVPLEFAANQRAALWTLEAYDKIHETDYSIRAALAFVRNDSEINDYTADGLRRPEGWRNHGLNMQAGEGDIWWKIYLIFLRRDFPEALSQFLELLVEIEPVDRMKFYRLYGEIGKLYPFEGIDNPNMHHSVINSVVRALLSEDFERPANPQVMVDVFNGAVAFKELQLSWDHGRHDTITYQLAKILEQAVLYFSDTNEPHLARSFQTRLDRLQPSLSSAVDAGVVDLLSKRLILEPLDTLIQAAVNDEQLMQTSTSLDQTTIHYHRSTRQIADQAIAVIVAEIFGPSDPVRLYMASIIGIVKSRGMSLLINSSDSQEILLSMGPERGLGVEIGIQGGSILIAPNHELAARNRVALSRTRTQPPAYSHPGKRCELRVVK